MYFTTKLNNIKDLLVKKTKLTICACGTSFYAGMVGKIILEELCEVDVLIEQASEYRYRKTLINKDDIMIVLSQSGETADTAGCSWTNFMNMVEKPFQYVMF